MRRHGGALSCGAQSGERRHPAQDEADAQDLIGRFFTQFDNDVAAAELRGVLLRLSAVAEALGERLQVLEVNPLKLVGAPSPRVVALDGVLTLNEKTTS